MIIVGRKGSNGKVRYSAEPVFVIDTAYYVDKRSAFCELQWLRYVLETLGLDEDSQDTGVPGLSREVAHERPIAIPPLEEQRRIAAFLDYETARIDELVHEKEELAWLLTERRTAVVVSAVGGAVSLGIKCLDELPSGWVDAKLGFRYEVALGKMLDAKQNVGGDQYPYFRNQDVQWRRINAADLPTIRLEPEEVSRFTVSSGDVLVCEGGDVGRAAIWRGPSGVFAYQKALHRLRPLNTMRDLPEYLVYQLMAAKAMGVFDRGDKRSTIAHLTAEAFQQYRFGFPPADVQRGIVSSLDVVTKRIDELATEAATAAAVLQERRSALITAAVTGQIDVRSWRPPDGWTTPETA